MTLPPLAETPAPPYYAVIFTSHRHEVDDGYAQMAERMLELARCQPGFLGVESARDGLGITVSYWADLDSIRQWREPIRDLAKLLGEVRSQQHEHLVQVVSR